MLRVFSIEDALSTTARGMRLPMHASNARASDEDSRVWAAGRLDHRAVLAEKQSSCTPLL